MFTISEAGILSLPLDPTILMILAIIEKAVS
jgi:hypothetical protein